MRKLWIYLMVTVMMIFALVPAAQALDIRQGTRLTVAKGETVNDDLLLTGDSMIIDGTVDGDVYAFGGVVTVNGTINGNLITAGSQVEVQGTVTGTVLGAGSGVYVNGRIEHSLLAAGSSVTLDSTGSVGHTLVAFADHVVHRGNVGRAMISGGTDITVEGQVGKELRAWSDHLRVGAPSVIHGPVIYTSKQAALIDSTAKTGEITHLIAVNNDWNRMTWWASRWWQFFKFTGFLIVGLLFLALFPGVRRNFPALVTDKPWQVPLTGFVSLVAFPIAATVLMLTVIGIPLSLLSILAFPALIYLGQVLVSWAVAKLLAERVEFMAGWSWPVLFLVGALLTSAVIRVPEVGWIFGLTFLLYGLGGVLHMLYPKRPTV